ncbi:MAG: hypothetical protein ACK5N8_04415 [Alphaproteobacteria bacterium]
MKNVRFRNLFLRLLPYFISLLSGAIIYHLSDIYWTDEEFSTLLMNLASTLLSVPIVFIFYEVVNDFCTRNLNHSLSKSLIFEINYAISDLITVIQSMLGIEKPLDREELYIILNYDREFILKNLVINEDISKKIEDEKKKLFNISHGHFNLSVLNESQIKAILAIIRNITLIYKEIEKKKDPNKDMITENLFQAIQYIAKWVYLSSDDDNGIVKN